MKRYLLWLRVNLGFWIIGREFGAAVGLLMLTRDRALDCITPDGSVVLAKCAPLARVLYQKIPGDWNISVASVPSGRDPGGEG